MALFQKKKKLTQKDAENLLPLIRDFNKAANILLRLLNTRVEEKERKIAVWVTNMTIPKSTNSINIQTVDIKNTMVSKKGGYSGNQLMKWENEAMRSNNRGYLI
ncbi:MAG: hypothetical protein WC860_02375 [Candidatus Margulisiibacteriota bacterium]|jgi:hypothetical protein